MSPPIKALLLPEWLRYWLEHKLFYALGLQPYYLAIGLLRGIFDTLLLFMLGFGLLTGSRVYMTKLYALPTDTQEVVLKWAPIADYIARQSDIPREVPLVLWYKENSMQAINPELCTGIMGAYDLVRSGEYPCFEPGPISDMEVSRQLAIGAIEFKKRCPEIHYLTQDPALIKQCYFAYNAGSGAASRLDANNSAYVMNGYDASHKNMVYTDVELGTVAVTSLGAWPTHLAFQSLIISQWDSGEGTLPPMALPDITLRLYDWLDATANHWLGSSEMGENRIVFSSDRNLGSVDCIGKPHILGRPSLRPRLNPVSESPVLTQDIHGCNYGLPGVDISSENATAVLLSPMPGAVTTYTDQWYNSTIRVENEEWIVWMLHPRSYLVNEGDVERGDAVGVMGAVGYATGPHVHFSVYDKVNQTFVDPSLFLP